MTATTSRTTRAMRAAIPKPAARPRPTARGARVSAPARNRVAAAPRAVPSAAEGAPAEASDPPGGVPGIGLRAALKPSGARAHVPWLLEGVLAGAGAVWMVMSGVTLSTSGLAKVLCFVSVGGLMALLLVEAVGRWRWMAR